VGKKTLDRATSGIGSIEPTIRTVAVCVSEPPHSFFAVNVYVCVSFNEPFPCCFGSAFTVREPVGDTDPSGSMETELEFDVVHARLLEPCSRTLSPIRRYRISPSEACNELCTAVFTLTVASDVTVPPGPEAWRV